VEPFIEEGKDAQFDKCAGWGHSEFRCPQLGMLRCGLCGDKHRTSEHKCQVAGCGQKGKCRHLQAKCANCGGSHPATWTGCAFARSARTAARGGSRSPPPPPTQKATAKGKAKATGMTEEDILMATSILPEEDKTKEIQAADWSDRATPTTASGSDPSMS
jgi:hypothetical protein